MGATIRTALASGSAEPLKAREDVGRELSEIVQKIFFPKRKKKIFFPKRKKKIFFPKRKKIFTNLVN
jgi:hypothetical protein